MMLEVALWPLLLGVVLFGLLPGASLRLIVRIYPEGDPRRRELVAELYTVDYQRRPFFVAQNLELALFEGLPARWKSRRRPNDVAGVEALMPETGYRGLHVCKIAGITYRQLDYWVRTDLIRPSIADASTPQRRYSYSYTDILELKLVKLLLESGVSLRAARKAMTFLRQQGGDIATANLWLSDGRSVLVRRQEELSDLVRQVGGVLSVVPLAQVKDEVDDAILSLPGTGT
jgi:DNA-binding transcriptional MerR regulator